MCASVNSLVCSQCYHLPADACQRESKKMSTTSVLSSTEQLPYKHSLSFTQTHTHTCARTTAMMKPREGELEEKKILDRRRQKRRGEKEPEKRGEKQGVRDGGEWRESCVLNIPLSDPPVSRALIF